MEIGKFIGLAKDNYDNIVYRIRFINGKTSDIHPNDLKYNILEDDITLVNLDSDLKNTCTSEKTGIPKVSDDDISKLLYKSKILGLGIKNISCYNLVDNEAYSYLITKSPNESILVIPNNIKLIGLLNDTGRQIDRTFNKLSVVGGYGLEAIPALFESCNIIELDLSRFDTQNVVDMRYLFNKAYIGNMDLSQLNVNNVKTMYSMFNSIHIPELQITNWCSSELMDVRSMFKRCTCDRIEILSMGLGQADSFEDMFYGSRIDTLKIVGLNTLNITNMSYMFYDAKINHIGLGNFKTQNVRTMLCMFCNCNIGEIDLRSFKTHNVENMDSMFNNSIVGDLDLRGFTSTKLRYATDMFLKTRHKQLLIVDEQIKRLYELSRKVH